jgi:serpin B
MKRFLLCLALALIALPAASAGAGEAEDRDKARLVDTPAITRSNTKFALDLYGRLRSKEGNLFLSPFSISTVLAMTSAGARGKTLEEMTRVLNLPEQKALHTAFGRRLKELNGAGKKRPYELTAANALWKQTDHKFLPDYVKQVNAHYRATIQEVNFASDREQARKTINDWVARQTQNRIKDFLPDGLLSEETKLVLTNAICFKGDWASQFKEKRTKELDFYIAPDKTVQTPMMSQEGEFGFFARSDMQMLELPYAGKDLSMVILRPKKLDGLAELEKSLTPETLDELLSNLLVQKVEVVIPRFKVTAQFNMKKELTSLGLESLFGPSADLSGMDGAKGMYLSDVVHKAFVEVNEKGTEAAAATGAAGARSSAPLFKADRPFLFLIRDRSGSILFLGRLVNPVK